jgi:predicted MFS family arabinose efflux permease
MIAPNISVLTALRFCHGLLFGICSTVVLAAAVRVIPEAQMGRGMGLFSTTGIGCQAVAPALGISISERWGYPVLFLITAAVAALAAPLMIAVKAQTRAKGDSIRAREKRKKISIGDIFAVEALGLAVLVIFFTVAPSTITNFLVLFGKDRGIEGVGYYFTIYAAVLIGIRCFCGSVIDRYPFRRIVYVCAVLCGAGMITVGAAKSFAPLAVAAVLLGVGYGAVMPALQAAVVRSVSNERKGVAGATFYIGMDIAYTIGSLAMGFVAEAFGYAEGFFMLCAPLLASIPLAMYCGRAGRGDASARRKLS